MGNKNGNAYNGSNKRCDVDKGAKNIAIQIENAIELADHTGFATLMQHASYNRLNITKCWKEGIMKKFAEAITNMTFVTNPELTKSFCNTFIKYSEDYPLSSYKNDYKYVCIYNGKIVFNQTNYGYYDATNNIMHKTPYHPSIGYMSSKIFPLYQRIDDDLYIFLVGYRSLWCKEVQANIDLVISTLFPESDHSKNLLGVSVSTEKQEIES